MRRLRNSIRNRYVILFFLLITLLVIGYCYYQFSSKTESTSLQKSITYVQQTLQSPQPTFIPNLPTGRYREPIITYHYVEYVKNKKDVLRQKMNINPHLLEEQLASFAQHHIQSYKISEPHEISNNEVILTFDDGYADFYDNVLPLLQKYQMKATLYVITEKVGEQDYVTWDQLHAIQDSQLIEIGAHTRTHPDLSKLSNDEALAEIQNSKQDLEQKLNIKVTSFAYPYGKYNPNTPALVQQAGFQNAVTTDPSVWQQGDHPYELHRVRAGALTQKDPASLLSQL